MRIGFIGVGNIGLPMARQIMDAGYSMVVNDLRREAAGPLLDAGAEWADSAREVAESCGVVCTCLPGPPEMEQAALGSGGLVQGLEPGSVYLDHTTNSPELVKRVHREVVKRGAAMLDAPVSGGKEGAQTRDLTVLVGGDSETLERVRPVLDAMAKTVMHVGPIGSGCVGKLMHNCAIFSLEQAMVECLTLGVRAGVEPAVMVEVFQKAALGRNMGLHVRLPATLFRGDFDPRFALGVAYKDMSLAAKMAETHDVTMPVTEATQRAMAEAMERGWADRDSSIFLTLQEERAGAQVRV